jgi:hypothetical protein
MQRRQNPQKENRILPYVSRNFAEQPKAQQNDQRCHGVNRKTIARARQIPLRIDEKAAIYGRDQS